jgi:metallo-beta-lactamase family protein
LQEEEARLANKWKYSKHHPAEPLYTLREAKNCLELLRPLDFHESFEPAPGIGARYTRAGHILGAGCLSLYLPEGTLVFSGDVGRPEDLVMMPPEPLAKADFLVVESTYGDRRHPGDDAEEIIAGEIRETVEKRGVLLVPAFAVGRAQHILRVIASLKEGGSIPHVPVFLNSPMSINATGIYCDHAGEHRLSARECESLCAAAQYVRTAEESKALEGRAGPMVILAASGMATGGRILHHLKRFLPEPTTTVLFAGYQAPGTRGASLLAGSEEVKIHGRYVPVKAKIRQVEGLSSHADYAELIAWLRQSGISPRKTFVTHGDPAAADSFRLRLKEAFGWNAVVPREDEAYEIG